MKKQLLSIALLLILSGAMAQNYKNNSATANYLTIPEIIQSSSINTYNVVISGYEDDLSNLGYSAGVIENKLNLRAFTRVDGEGENKIVFRFSGYGNRYGNMNSVTGQDGKSKYYYTYSYTLPMSYDIYASGRKIAGAEVKMERAGMGAATEQFVFNSKYFGSSTAASEYWNSGEGKGDLINHIKGNFDKKLESFVKIVRETIDYQASRGSAKFGYFKTTKKADYTDYERAAESAERALAPLQSGQPREGLRQRLDSAMNFWQAKMITLDPLNKDQDKLFFACANNMAVSHYWTDNLDSASYFIVQAERADVREGWLSMLKHDIEARKKQLASLKASGIDPYMGPEVASEQEVMAIAAKAQKERMERDAEIAARIAAEERKYAPVIDRVSGYVIGRDDKKVTGTFNCYKANNGDKTGRNFFVADGAQNEEELSASFIKYCEFGSEKYELVKFGDAITRETKLLRVYYKSNKISVYKDFVPVKNSDRTLVYVYFKKPAEEVATNTSNITFTVAYKKMLAKYFEDCPTLADKALAGSYTDSDDMRIAAAVDYTNNCK